ncbi:MULTISPECIES: hypothetical protein [unclassified Corallococcus]|uniref:hypothetical protein n=1 Tax=unclassified Corallococcus TaxID=2685029 RepID=UPI001A8EE4F8|nr:MULTISPECIES: hypothetical protein [unclassified Corallococcus]MBN9688340.1 hypothetical protein [Corallococcus sp. NCSPR001]WAS87858.1 hypothetical protein O0N60_12960 [Corallococcus sp. NCRR]
MTSRLALFSALLLGSVLFGLAMLATALSGGAALPVALVLGLGLLALVLFTVRRAPAWRSENAFALSGTAWKWLSLAGALLSGLGAAAVVLDELSLPRSSDEWSHLLIPLAFVLSFLGGWLVSAALLGACGLLRAISSKAVWGIAVSVPVLAFLVVLAVFAASA